MAVLAGIELAGDRARAHLHRALLAAAVHGEQPAGAAAVLLGTARGLGGALELPLLEEPARVAAAAVVGHAAKTFFGGFLAAWGVGEVARVGAALGERLVGGAAVVVGGDRGHFGRGGGGFIGVGVGVGLALALALALAFAFAALGGGLPVARALAGGLAGVEPG